MKTKFKRILLGLLSTLILFFNTTTTTLCDQLSEPATNWTQLKGVAERSAEGHDVVVDKDGNSYMVGYIGNFDTDIYTSEGFVSKYAADGSKLWTKQFGAPELETYANGVALDSLGNCYVLGYTNSKLDNLELTGNTDTFIIKYKPNGTKEWLKLVGVPNAYIKSDDIKFDKSDNFYITGSTDGNLNNQVLTGLTDLFIAKYNSAGVHQWTRLLGSAKSYVFSKELALDNHDNIYITGSTYGTLDGQNLKISSDGFVVKYDSKGNKKWSQLVGSVSTGDGDCYAEAASIALDSNGNCFISGNTMGKIDDKTKIGLIDSYIIAYTPDGKKLWSKLFGLKKASMHSGGIVIDSLNNLYLNVNVCGAHIGQINLIGLMDTFVIKYNVHVKEEWIKQLGVANGNVSGYGITVDKNNHLYVVGMTATDLEGQSKIGLTDAFITTYFNK